MNKKIIFIVSVSLLIVVLIALFYFLMLKKNLPLGIDLGLNNTNQTEQIELAKKAEEQAAVDYQNNLAFVYAQNVDNCLGLIETAKINKCIKDIAVQANRKDYCEKVANDDKLKNECLNSIDYINVSWGADPNKCDTLSDKNFQDTCYQEYFVKLADLTECNIVNNEERKKQCLDLVNYRLATVFNKTEACGLISEAVLKDACALNKQILPKDSDNDGLPDEVEMSFGTNPFKADTDNDGKSDYEEINKYQTNPRIAN